METLTFRHPRLVALIILVLVSAGLSSFLSLGRQEDPTITNLFATVTTQFPGADPERVEALVTAEIEEELRKIAEVDEISSVSRSGVSVVSVELLETLDEATIEQVWAEARDAVEDARQTFPAGVLPPDFDAEGISAYSAVIAVAADSPDFPVTLLSRHAEALGDRLRAIPATRAVEYFGQPDEEVLVSVDMDRAAALGLSAAEISQRIAEADGKVQSGRLQSDVDLTINISGEIETLDRIRSIVLRESAEGAVVQLGDIASVDRGARNPQSSIAFANGKPAVLVGVLAQDGVQIDRWTGFLREELAAGVPSVPLGVQEVLLFDQSQYTTDRLTEVGINMAIGVALVVAVLFITLGVRAAAIVALVLPVVSLATLATMNMIGLPIHQMSVTGLIVALGLLVDAAIVMTDEIRRRLQDGMARIAAVQDAVRRLAAPLLASTVTTALAFTPMILLPGPAGDFVGAIAIAVVLMLVWSLGRCPDRDAGDCGLGSVRPPGCRNAEPGDQHPAACPLVRSLDPPVGGQPGSVHRTGAGSARAWVRGLPDADRSVLSGCRPQPVLYRGRHAGRHIHCHHRSNSAADRCHSAGRRRRQKRLLDRG